MAALQIVDQRFFESAPIRYSHRWSIGRPPSEVWAELVGDRPLHWCRGLTVNWTSPRPFSVETTRQAKILGVLKVREFFFAWEEGRRYTFYATEANLPLFHRVAEDYIVEPDGPNRCTFTWKIALAPTLIGKAGEPRTACCSTASLRTPRAISRSHERSERASGVLFESHCAIHGARASPDTRI